MITEEMIKEATELKYPKCIKELLKLLKTQYKYSDTDFVSPIVTEKPASRRLLEQFESDFDITIPDIYRCFLTEVSDGCTLSSFSLYKVADLGSYNKHLIPSAEDDEQLDNLLHEMAKDSSFRTALLGDDCDMRNEEKFAVLEDIINDDIEDQSDVATIVEDDFIDGIIFIIGEYKSTYDIAIVCGGSHDAEIVLVDWDRNRPHLQNVMFDVWLRDALLAELAKLEDYYQVDTEVESSKHTWVRRIAMLCGLIISVGALYKFLRKNRD